MHLAFFQNKTDGTVRKWTPLEVEELLAAEIARSTPVFSFFRTRRGVVEDWRKAYHKVIEDVKKESIKIP